MRTVSARLLPTTLKPASCSLGLTSGDCTAATMARPSASCSGSGVPAGTKTANQAVTSTFGRPASVKVGTSGSCGSRCAEVTPSARILPPLTCAAAKAVLTKAACTSPAMIAVTASPVAR